VGSTPAEAPGFAHGPARRSRHRGGLRKQPNVRHGSAGVDGQFDVAVVVGARGRERLADSVGRELEEGELGLLAQALAAPGRQAGRDNVGTRTKV